MTASLREALQAHAKACREALRSHQERPPWTGGSLRAASLRSLSLAGVRLDLADLEAADLRDACLLGADLRGANLTAALLIRADLQRADLSGVQLDRAVTEGVLLDGARGVRTAGPLPMPDLWRQTLIGVAHESGPRLHIGEWSGSAAALLELLAQQPGLRPADYYDAVRWVSGVQV